MIEGYAQLVFSLAGLNNTNAFWVLQCKEESSVKNFGHKIIEDLSFALNV